MTTRQLILMNCVYLALLGGATFFTRATWRRVMGALAGGAFAGLLLLAVIVLGEAFGVVACAY